MKTRWYKKLDKRSSPIDIVSDGRFGSSFGKTYQRVFFGQETHYATSYNYARIQNAMKTSLFRYHERSLSFEKIAYAQAREHNYAVECQLPTTGRKTIFNRIMREPKAEKTWIFFDLRLRYEIMLDKKF